MAKSALKPELLWNSAVIIYMIKVYILINLTPKVILMRENLNLSYILEGLSAVCRP